MGPTLKALLGVFTAFWGKYGSNIISAVSGAAAALLVNERNKAQDELEGVQKFNALEHTARTDVDRLRKRF